MDPDNTKILRSNKKVITSDNIVKQYNYVLVYREIHKNIRKLPSGIR